MGWAKYDRRAYQGGSHRESKLEETNDRLTQENARLRRQLADAVWNDLRPQAPRATDSSDEAVAGRARGLDGDGAAPASPTRPESNQ